MRQSLFLIPPLLSNQLRGQRNAGLCQEHLLCHVAFNSVCRHFVGKVKGISPSSSQAPQQEFVSFGVCRFSSIPDCRLPNSWFTAFTTTGEPRTQRAFTRNVIARRLVSGVGTTTSSPAPAFSRRVRTGRRIRQCHRLTNNPSPTVSRLVVSLLEPYAGVPIKRFICRAALPASISR